MMVILNTKELRLTVQMAHITTALSFLLIVLLIDFKSVFESCEENKEMINGLLCKEFLHFKPYK